MVRISKLTDYGIVIMVCIAGYPARVFQTREISESTGIAKPTVSKLLKKLMQHQWLSSHRGTHGGYSLACTPNTLTIADLVSALEGPIAITECNLGHSYCATETQCTVKTSWQRINQAITTALQAVKLSDLVNTQGYQGGHP